MRINQNEAMLKAICQHFGLTQIADAWAAGENNGGKYVALFYSKLQYRVAVVYEEHFNRLPDFIQDAIDDRLAAGDVSTERERAAKAGVLNECPLFGFTRYQVGRDDDDKARWKFGDVLWVSSKHVHTLKPQPASWNTKAADAAADRVRDKPLADPKPQRTPGQRPEPPVPSDAQALEFGMDDVPTVNPVQNAGEPFDPAKAPTFHSAADMKRWAVNMVDSWDIEAAGSKLQSMKQQMLDDGDPVVKNTVYPRWIALVREARQAELAFA